MAEELKMKYPYLHLVGSDEDPIYYKPYRDMKHISMANGELYRVKSYTVKYM